HRFRAEWAQGRSSRDIPSAFTPSAFLLALITVTQSAHMSPALPSTVATYPSRASVNPNRAWHSPETLAMHSVLCEGSIVLDFGIISPVPTQAPDSVQTRGSLAGRVPREPPCG